MNKRTPWHGNQVLRQQGEFAQAGTGNSAPAGNQPAGALGRRKGKPRILFAEDFEPVYTAVRGNLLNLGFDVLGASDGARALVLAAQERFDLLLTDIHMPIMGGIELARRLRQDRPGLPLLFLSGGIQLQVAKQIFWGGSVAFLEKPCSSHALAEAIRHALGERASPFASTSTPSSLRDQISTKRRS